MNVGHVGLFRYSRIFQRVDTEVMPVNVACLADRDIPPKEAKPLLPAKRKTEDMYTKEQIEKKVATLKRNDGGAVRTFVSPTWTLEYDLARTPLASHIHGAISLAVAAKQKGVQPGEEDRTDTLTKASDQCDAWAAEGKSVDEIACLIYEPLLTGRASKPEAAQYLAQMLPSIAGLDVAATLPEYLVDAINFVTGGQTGEGAVAPPVTGI